MTTMLDKMARAMAYDDFEDFDVAGTGYEYGAEFTYYSEDEARGAFVEANWKAWISAARAALQATRDLSPEIILRDLSSGHAAAWKTTVDAILEEKPE